MMLIPRTYRGSMSPYMKYLPRLPRTCRSELLSYKFAFSRWLVGTKHPFWDVFLDSGKCFWILGSVLDSGTCFWIRGSVLDSGKCFWILGSVFDSGKCFWILGSVFGFWEVFWILGSVFGFWEVFWVFLDSGKCFGFWEVFCPYEPPYISHIMQLWSANWSKTIQKSPSFCLFELHVFSV